MLIRAYLGVDCLVELRASLAESFRSLVPVFDLVSNLALATNPRVSVVSHSDLIARLCGTSIWSCLVAI